MLVDFWTYTCVNCIRTLPRLRQWHERYAAHGLTIVGVHTPEFDFERDADNVAEAVGRLGIAYSVAQDNDYLTWQAFYNCCWPGKYLIGVDGALVYRHVGEGAYQSTEGAIREALEAAGYDLSGVPPGEEPDPDFDPVATAQTRELYGGYARNFAPLGVYAGQEAYYGAPDEVRDYVDTGERLDGMWYLQGLWRTRARGDRARPHHRGPVGLLRVHVPRADGAHRAAASARRAVRHGRRARRSAATAG